MTITRLILLSLAWTSTAAASCARRNSTATSSAGGPTHVSNAAGVAATTPSGCSASTTWSNVTSSPVIDLTYALHAAQVATSLDSRTYYNFSNIRYAAPPVDALRFQLPQDPTDNRTAGVQDGSYGKICPQAYTPWQNSALVTAPPGEAESEDCLFLDVVVPKTAWDQRCNTSRPVIVWIHGGGFQIGAKWGTPLTNPLGLLDRSFDDDGEGAIWIGLQYRVSQSYLILILPARMREYLTNISRSWARWDSFKARRLRHPGAFPMSASMTNARHWHGSKSTCHFLAVIRHVSPSWVSLPAGAPSYTT